jgi:hypothetical protein
MHKVIKADPWYWRVSGFKDNQQGKPLVLGKQSSTARAGLTFLTFPTPPPNFH